MDDLIITAAQQLFRSATPKAKAPAPAVGLKTGIANTLTYPGSTGILTMAVAADGSLWTATKSELGQYSTAVDDQVKVCDMAYHNPGPLSFGRYIAPVSSKRAFFIQSRAGKRVLCEYQEDTPVSDLPALPDNDTPMAASAASDGTLWVLSSSGKAWLYGSGASPWRVVAPDAGTTIKQISVGKSDFVLAVAQKSGQAKLLRYSEGKWIDHVTTAPAGLQWVGACKDGSYWWSSADMMVPGELRLVRPGLTDLTFLLEGGAMGFTASTRRACYFYSLSVTGFGFKRAAYGVLDQPAEAFPAMNAGETKGYKAISTELGITDPNGVRSQYTSAIATFSVWFTKVSQMAKPATVPQTDWDSIQDQIKDELEYVQGVTNLFVNIALLNTNIGLVNTNTYNQVVGMVGLPDTPAQQPKTIVSVIFDKLVGKLESAVVGKAKAFVGSEVVDIGMACLKFAGDQTAKEHNLPDGSVPLKIACSDLAGALSSRVVKLEKARSEFQQAILGDWGRLGACGEAIRSGVWFWRPGLNYETLAGAGEAIALEFYQTLMPAKWKIILCQGLMSFQPPMNPFMRNVPGYSLMFKYVSDAKSNRVYWWWACAEVGSKVEQQNEGPYPNQKTMEAIFKLGTTPLDFFTGGKGWTLGVFEVPGYRPPPDGLGFQDYVNSSKPLG
ncbi:MAG: hypothetical protein AABO41_03755 [Acidobacteriota bacterium]